MGPAVTAGGMACDVQQGVATTPPYPATTPSQPQHDAVGQHDTGGQQHGAAAVPHGRGKLRQPVVKLKLAASASEARRVRSITVPL